MGETLAPERLRVPDIAEDIETDTPWIVIVWDDPVNLMDYVVLVFRRLFGFTKARATKLMLQVHNEGRAVVSSGAKERAEADCARLHHHGLWATIERQS